MHKSARSLSFTRIIFGDLGISASCFGLLLLGISFSRIVMAKQRTIGASNFGGAKSLF
jgi:hypothetical protein